MSLTASRRLADSKSVCNSATSIAMLPLCHCCPYGYHIDLDFVRYCEVLANSVTSEGERIRRDRRRQRKSMEVMLGFEHLQQQQQQQQHSIQPLPSAVEEVCNEYDRSAAAWTSDYEFYGNGTGGGSGRESWETSEFIRDVLEDVCVDFERTLEHTKVKQRRTGQRMRQRSESNDNAVSYDACITVPGTSSGHQNSYQQHHQHPNQYQHHERLEASPNQHYPHFTTYAQHQQHHYDEQRIDDTVDSQRRESFEPAMDDSPAERECDRESLASNGSEISTGALQHIREQMAISLSRMRDLEEQVKLVPLLQQQLAAVRKEKRQLQLNARIELKTPSAPTVPPAVPTAPPQPNIFVTQRINPIALEAMNKCLSNAVNRSSELGSIEQSTPKVNFPIKRDVASMTTASVSRDIGVSTNHVQLRSLGTQYISETKMYTKEDLQAAIDVTIDRQRRDMSANKISVGTQMQPDVLIPPSPPKPKLRNVLVQTNPEVPLQRHDAQVQSVSIQQRSYGCNVNTFVPEPCAKCSVSRQTVACGSDVNLDFITVGSSEPQATPAISLQSLGMMPPRSSTFCLGEMEKLAIKRRSVATQSSPAATSTTGTQYIPSRTKSTYSQHTPSLGRNQETDTIGLRPDLLHCAINTEPLQPAPIMKHVASSIEPAERIDRACNTAASPRMREQGTQPLHIQRKEVACGGSVRPHIWISCAENYCDTCKDSIRVLAKDFTPTATTGVQSTIPHMAASPSMEYSRIPRPMALASPRADRKFVRQNTYTLTSGSSSTASTPGTEERSPPFGVVTDAADTQQIRFTGSPKCPKEQSVFGADTEENALTKSTVSVSNDETQSERRNEETKEMPQNVQNFDTDNHIHDLRTEFERSYIVTNTGNLENEACIDDVEIISDFGNINTISTISNLSDVSNIDNSETTTTFVVPITEFPPSIMCKERENRLVMPAGPSRTDELLLARAAAGPRTKAEPNREMHAALKVISDALQKPSATTTNIKAASKIVQKEWFKISSMEEANPLDVDDYLDCFEEFSNQLLRFMVNLSDLNGNTAMHYAVSHGNFDVVSILLDSKVCDVNQTNNAGYTCVMLVSLAKLKISAHHTVVQRLFQMSDVNIRAKKHCQTALMLAVSHGNLDMVHMLLNAGADINIQDADGSTALMCAAEHGRIDIVKLLLAQPDCDSTIQDIDGSTALKISLEAGYRDIGVLLYAHEHITRNKTSPYTSLRRKKKPKAGLTPTQSMSTPASPAPSKKFHHSTK